ncbi:cysteine-rich Secretory family protein [Ceratobasidium sp. AG-Ba]|nr:cysteine-rich Secretory family protein [Ceratobasidium sp. AG-Ba]
MHFVRASTVAGAILFLINVCEVAATNQQLMDCEAKCSQHWSFPAPAPSSVSSTKTKTKTSHTPSPTPTYAPPPSHTPKPTSSPPLVNNAQVKQTPSSQEPIPIPTPSPKPSTSKPAPAPAPTSAPAQPEPAPSSSTDIAAYLDPHNAARAAHGASPLTWSDELASAAQKWANGCVFQHSGGKVGPYGENLAAGSGDYSPGSGVQAWVNEAPEYSSSNPVPSHFTQVVWKATTKVGCAVASCNLANFDKQFWPVKFHVCEYSSAGNVIGQFAQNVQA